MLARFWHARHLARGTAERAPRVTTRQIRRAVVRCKGPIEYHVDGEPGIAEDAIEIASGRARCWSRADDDATCDGRGARRMSELIEAAKAGDRPGCSEILQPTRPPPAARDESGESALMAALYRGHRDIANEIADAQIAAGDPLDVFAAAALGRDGPVGGARSRDPAARSARLPTTAGPRCTWPRSSASSMPPRACSKRGASLAAVSPQPAHEHAAPCRRRRRARRGRRCS